jgi:hypothetical protein
MHKAFHFFGDKSVFYLDFAGDISGQQKTVDSLKDNILVWNQTNDANFQFSPR